MEKRTALLYRIKEIHRMYERSNNAQRALIFDASMRIVGKLEALGYHRELVESLIMFGADFLRLDSMVNSEYYRKTFPEAFAVFEV